MWTSLTTASDLWSAETIFEEEQAVPTTLSPAQRRADHTWYDPGLQIDLEGKVCAIYYIFLSAATRIGSYLSQIHYTVGIGTAQHVLFDGPKYA